MLRIVTGEAGIVIGTHALLEDKVEFADLGLVVVDEQHRFGVEQRAALTDKAGTPPHVLVMTATPIPRTVAMTVFGDLETSVARRAASRARAHPDQRRPAGRPADVDRPGLAAGARGGRAGPPGLRRVPADHGRRAGGGRDRPARPRRGRRRRSPPSVRSPRWRTSTPSSWTGPLAGLRIAVLHGRMAPDDKDRTMRAFAAGDLDVLVSTTVIEVGVDVAQRHHDGAPRRRPVRRLPAPPAARPRRPGRPARALPAGHPRRARHARPRTARRGGGDHRRLRAQPRRPRAAPRGRRARAPTSRASAPASSHLGYCATRRRSSRAREAAEALLSEDPALAQAPALADVVAEVERSAASEFMEKG